MNHKEFGNWAEDTVRDLYIQKGYTLIAQNFEYYKSGRQGRHGELDLIFIHQEVLVIVEVKARMSETFGKVEEQISQTKLMTIAKTLEYFLLKNQKFQGLSMRFDVALVTPKKIQVIPNACQDFDF